MNVKLDCASFFNALTSQGVRYFTGVPDSLLKEFCAYVQDHAAGGRHIIAANEGAAVALACGHHLATRGIGLVYMQNSGLGNAVNPLTSLTSPLVYGIPLLLLVGWRGEPGVPDEPQHRQMGEITEAMLSTLGVAHSILPADDLEAAECLNAAVRHCTAENRPYALLVKAGTFAPYESRAHVEASFSLTREAAVCAVVDSLTEHDVVVSTTGKTSRELYEYRVSKGHDLSRDFLTVGSMGHASQIALGIAGARPEREVYCIDGDGSTIMHMGSMAIVGTHGPRNFRHVIINNGAHDSVGAQPTVGFQMDLPAVAVACGYRYAMCASTIDQIGQHMRTLTACDGPVLLEIKARTGSRADLGRPQSTPEQNKFAFMDFLNA